MAPFVGTFIVRAGKPPRAGAGHGLVATVTDAGGGGGAGAKKKFVSLKSTSKFGPL